MSLNRRNAKKFPENKFPFIRFFIGDIRDKEDFTEPWRILI